jgi:triphosphoribosyl-dephospho-CoA synthase
MTVTAEAAAAAATLTQTSDTQTCIPPLMEFDASLKARGLNPGTTADMTVAALFAAGLTNKAESRA